MNWLIYLQGLVEQWERGVLDPEDFVRQVRQTLSEEREIAEAEES